MWNSSRLTVLAIVAVSLLVVAGLWLYLNERGGQAKLAAIDCAAMLPTTFELQGEPVAVNRDETCELLRMVAAMQPVGGESGDSETDPPHYFGRLRIRPRNDVWFLIFQAYPSEGFRPTFSLRHRRGNGWAIVGRFDAAPVLRLLDAEGGIDMQKLKSPAARTPVDQMTPM